MTLLIGEATYGRRNVILNQDDQDTGHTDEGHDFLGQGLGGGQRDQIDTKRISDTRTVTLAIVGHTPIYMRCLYKYLKVLR